MSLRKRVKSGEIRNKDGQRCGPQQAACSFLEVSEGARAKMRLNKNLQMAANPETTVACLVDLGRLERMRKSRVKRGKKPSERQLKELAAQMGDA
jgi:hypothetical protein